jgi:UDP-N-acetylglucosamine--N-acetylmuramyl-(pentapeptide) pyrophosphoryl-undecaprenol N-acetylglucosamine transferase
MLILREFDPAVVVGSGGYVSAPVIRAAYKLGMPIYFQEQNSLPGLATRTLGKMADTIFTAYESAARYLPAEKCRLVGNPLRPDLLDIRRDCGAKEFSLDSQKKTLLILGGSSGARSINDLVSGIFKAGSLPADWQILWQTGQKDFGEVSAALSGIKFSGRILPFIDNMSAAYACADLVLSRAGAMALAEMAARGLPSILIPYPHATGNHQTLNARAFGDTSAAILLAEPVPQENFESVLKNILADEGRRAQMSSNAKKLARPEAAKIIARTVLDRINEI